jgi:DNA-binding MarR family transcriptional regulator
MPLRVTNRLADSTGYVLRRASSHANAEFSALLAPLGLRVAEAGLLTLIAERPGITQSEAGRLLDIQRANMTPLCARLEDRGLLARIPVDGRSHGMILGQEGKKLMERLDEAIARHEALLTARVPEQLRPHVLPVLRALWGAADSD